MNLSKMSIPGITLLLLFSFNELEAEEINLTVQQ
jgi:hypothetical protein